MNSLSDSTLENNYAELLQRIRAAELLYKKAPGSVQLLAASKTQSSEKIKTLQALGQIKFGENYLSEALEKIKILRQHPIEWHFIGAIQSNKTKLIAENFSWVHSVCQLKTAEYLNKARNPALPRLNICIQLNISREPQKSGILAEELMEFAKQLQAFPQLRLRGLMVIPKPVVDFEAQKRIFQEVYDLQQELIANGFILDTLSMGMSDDLEAAIAAGSNCVRVGTAIFGKRGT